MSRTWRTLLLVLTAAHLILLLGCGSNGVVRPTLDGRVTVTGRVTQVDDQLPVDGGATISITTASGGTERLLFPSLFTSPPPSQQMIELYDVVRRLEVGDLIRAEGKRTTSGVELEALEILEEQP